MTTTRLTQYERFERRKEMAAEVKDGKEIVEVANKFQVTEATVRKACLENSVKIPGLAEKRKLAHKRLLEGQNREKAWERRINSPEDLASILTWILQGWSYAEIAEHFGVTKQRIGQIAAKAKEIGFFEAAKAYGKKG